MYLREADEGGVFGLIQYGIGPGSYLLSSLVLLVDGAEFRSVPPTFSCAFANIATLAYFLLAAVGWEARARFDDGMFWPNAFSGGRIHCSSSSDTSSSSDSSSRNSFFFPVSAAREPTPWAEC